MATCTSIAHYPGWEPPTTRRESDATVSHQHPAFSQVRVERAPPPAALDLALDLAFDFALDLAFFDPHNRRPGPRQARSPERRQAPDHHPRSNRERRGRHAGRQDHG